jgi:hypothetical protein
MHHTMTLRLALVSSAILLSGMLPLTGAEASALTTLDERSFAGNGYTAYRLATDGSIIHAALEITGVARGVGLALYDEHDQRIQPWDWNVLMTQHVEHDEEGLTTGEVWTLTLNGPSDGSPRHMTCSSNDDCAWSGDGPTFAGTIRLVLLAAGDVTQHHTLQAEPTVNLEATTSGDSVHAYWLQDFHDNVRTEAVTGKAPHDFLRAGGGIDAWQTLEVAPDEVSFLQFYQMPCTVKCGSSTSIYTHDMGRLNLYASTDTIPGMIRHLTATLPSGEQQDCSGGQLVGFSGCAWGGHLDAGQWKFDVQGVGLGGGTSILLAQVSLKLP